MDGYPLVPVDQMLGLPSLDARSEDGEKTVADVVQRLEQKPSEDQPFVSEWYMSVDFNVPLCVRDGVFLDGHKRLYIAIQRHVCRLPVTDDFLAAQGLSDF